MFSSIRWYTKELERRDRAFAEERARWAEERAQLVAELRTMNDRLMHLVDKTWAPPEIARLADEQPPLKEADPWAGIIGQPENSVEMPDEYVDPDRHFAAFNG